MPSDPEADIEILAGAQDAVERREPASGPRSGAGPVVVLGCSAGGLPALQKFFEVIETETGAAMVLVAHASPDFESLLPDLLQSSSPLRLRVASDGERLVENEVLVVPPRHEATFEADRLRLRQRSDASPDEPAGHSIDRCLISLAEQHADRGRAVILSGTGADGAIGIEHVADAGGTVIVQTTDSCEFSEMPRAAIATGRADHVLSPGGIARALMWLGRREPVARRLLAAAEDAEGSNDSMFRVITELVEADQAYGLERYDSRMLARRILQRMIAEDLATPEDYAARLRWDADERRRLLETMIDGETCFFRDRSSWQTLRELVVRRLVEDAGPEPIRVWVIGCSTGEDAYGIALQFEQEMQRADRRVKYNVFGTDIIADRVERASAGRFEATKLERISPAMMKRGFRIEGGEARAVPSLRRQLVFARHDVRVDPAFSRMDLVICRGVLSSFDEAGRQQAISRITHALRPGGTLFLGTEEQIDGAVAGLQPLHRGSGLHSRRSGAGGRPERDAASSTLVRSGRRGLRRRETTLTTALEAVLAREGGRMCLLLNTNGQLLHAFGETERFLAVKPGLMQTSVLELLIEPLRPVAEAALGRALRTGRAATIRGVELRSPAWRFGRAAADLTVAPVEGDGTDERQLSLVVEATPSASSGGGEDVGSGPQSDDAARIVALESELDRTRMSVRTLGEELVASHEQRDAQEHELKEVSRRAHENHAELLSVNEELYTVNREHEAKIRELLQLNNDMENLLQTAQVGTVFLDRDLRIRRRTPAADVLFGPGVSGTVGLEDVRLPEGVPPLAPDLQSVLRDADSIERQMRLADGRDYLMYLHPYRHTDDGRLDGVVLTIVDVTDLKRAEVQLRRLNTELRNRNQEAEAFAHTVSHDLKSPLVTIGCMMGLLRESLEEHPDAESIRYVDQTEATVRAMRQTIDDLLELSRVGRTRNRLTTVDLGELVHEVLRNHAPVLEKAGAEVKVAPGLPAIEADRLRLFQVLDNLIGNALKYGASPNDESTTIEIDVEYPASASGESGADARGIVVLSVADHGAGVPEPFREQIFGLFQRLRRDKPGTGVGLALVRRIVRAHGGRVWIEDRPGGGARFRIALPMRAPDEAEPLDLSALTSPSSDGTSPRTGA